MEIDLSQIPVLSSLIIIFCLLVISAFFSGAEIALFTFRKTRLLMLVRQGNKTARLIDRMMKRPQRVLGTILVGNNIVAILISILGTTLSLNLFGKNGIWIAFLGITFLLVLFGEIIPKVIASQFWEKFAFAAVRPIWTLMKLLYPIVTFFSFLSNTLFRLFGVRIKYKRPFITKDELQHIVTLSKETGHLKKDEVTLLENVFAFQDRLVKEVMFPRKQMVALDINLAPDEMSRRITEGHHTRLPVYDGTLDNIIGVLHTKEYLNVLCYKNTVKIQDLLRPTYFTTEKTKISELLRELQKQHLHLAVVKDKEGKVSGIITIEDILEEIVGEIRDEYEKISPPATSTPKP